MSSPLGIYPEPGIGAYTPSLTQGAYTPSLTQGAYTLRHTKRGIYPEPHSSLSPSPTPTLYAQPCRYQEPMPYALVDRDEYGVSYAALTFDSPEHARDHLRWLLSQTDNTVVEMALQAELEEVEMSCEDLLRKCDIIQSGGKETNHVRDFEVRE